MKIKIVNEKEFERNFMERFAMILQAELKNTIARDTPHILKTGESKSGLVEAGDFLRRTNATYSGGEIEINSDLSYSAYLEYGTINIPAFMPIRRSILKAVNKI